MITDSEFTRFKDDVLGNGPSPKAWPPITPKAWPPTTPGAEAKEIGMAHTQKTRNVTSEKKKTVQARNVRYEKKCGDVAADLHGMRSPLADTYFSAFSKTKQGQRQFPRTTASLVNDKHLLGLVENCQNTVDKVGKHSGRVVVRLLTKGLPTSFLKDVVGMTDKDLMKRRGEGVKKTVEDKADSDLGTRRGKGFKKRVEKIADSDLCQQNYTHDVTRSKITEVEKTMYYHYFDKTSSVFSGTERRCVTLPMREWESKVTHTHLMITINPRSHTSRYIVH